MPFRTADTENNARKQSTTALVWRSYRSFVVQGRPGSIPALSKRFFSPQGKTENLNF